MFASVVRMKQHIPWNAKAHATILRWPTVNSIAMNVAAWEVSFGIPLGAASSWKIVNALKMNPDLILSIGIVHALTRATDHVERQTVDATASLATLEMNMENALRKVLVNVVQTSPELTSKMATILISHASTRYKENVGNPTVNATVSTATLKISVATDLAFPSKTANVVPMSLETKLI